MIRVAMANVASRGRLHCDALFGPQCGCRRNIGPPSGNRGHWRPGTANGLTYIQRCDGSGFLEVTHQDAKYFADCLVMSLHAAVAGLHHQLRTHIMPNSTVQTHNAVAWVPCVGILGGDNIVVRHRRVKWAGFDCPQYWRIRIQTINAGWCFDAGYASCPERLPHGLKCSGR